MKVTIREWSIVPPSKQTPNHRLWLSNLDLIYSPFYALALYVYKPSYTCPTFLDTKLLKESLSKVLVTFYPLAGRLALDENGRRQIDCNAQGVTFVEAEADCPMPDYPALASNTFKLLPQLDFQTPFSNPLILVQVTRFRCGGVLLGIKAHHNAVDGEGGTHFVNAWSEIARGQPISIQPVFDRSFVRARHPPTPTFPHPEYDPPIFCNQIENAPQSFTSLFKIPIDLVDAFKSKVNNEEVKYSTFEILTAHLWRCCTRARSFSSDQPTTLIIPIDGRYRIPDFPKGYCGNVIFYATSMVFAGELYSEPLVKTTERVQKAIKQMSHDYLRSAIDYLENNIDSDQLLKYQGTQQLRRGSLFVNSWIRLPIFNADFGWGKPLTMVSPRQLEGIACFNPCLVGENEMTFVISFQEEHKKCFESLVYVLE